MTATAHARPLYLPAADAAELKRRAADEDFPSWPLDAVQLAELELLLSGVLAPLTGYPSRADCDRVRAERRLAGGARWPRPLALAVDGDVAATLQAGRPLALRDAEGVLIAVLTVAERWQEDRRVRLAGPVAGVEPPTHYDYPELRRLDRTPTGGRLCLLASAPLTPSQIVSLKTQAERFDDAPLVAFCAGIGDAGDRRYHAAVRYQRAALRRYLPAATLRLLSLPPPGRDQDLLFAARIIGNLGCDRLLIDGERLRSLAPRRDELDLELVALPDASPPHPDQELPAELSRELALIRPARADQGLTIFFTGLSGSGKSTVANALLDKLLAQTRRSVTLLDGDRVRQHLSSELGFSRRDRDLNILRIGYVASEITKHGGIAVCAPIAPYAATRAEVRTMIEAHGGFVEVHVATPLEVCEQRDRKGLYAKARAGLIKEFTGISDPYEVPERPELRLDTAAGSAADAADRVLTKLAGLGYLTPL